MSSDIIRSPYLLQVCLLSLYNNLDCVVGIRIEGSTSQNEGLVEVYLKETWHLICRETFDLQAANVACREFGLTEALEITNIFKQDQASHIMTSLKCTGNEERLTECQYEFGVSRSCPNMIYAGVVCREGEEKLHGYIVFLFFILILEVCVFDIL